MSLSVLCLLWACLLVSGSVGGPIHEDSEGGHHHDRHKRSAPTLSDRKYCNTGDQWPSTRVNTTQRLADLRAEMAKKSLGAYLIFSDDAHGSEYPSNSDKRRGFISGFTGSAGYAAVTMTKAALWTDGRYFLEAEDALDCNWIFMKQRNPGVPSLTEWLTSELTASQTVGADPYLVTNSLWQRTEKSLQKDNIRLVAESPNLVDIVWTNRPAEPNSTINALALKYAGRSWQDKIGDLHKVMEEKSVGAFVVTSLDETAWLLNLRASDIEFNPFFISYIIVEYYGSANSNNKVRLYIGDKDTRLTVDPSDPETTQKLYEHLNTNQDGSCTGKTGMCVEVRDYVSSEVKQDVSTLSASDQNMKIWITQVCNYAIFSAIGETQRVQERSFIAWAKAQKNPTEIQGMQMCNKRDSAVLVEFLAKMEKEVMEGKQWTEVSASDELERMRRAATNNRGLSFASIAGSGPNGAVIHYRPSSETDRPLTTSDMFLLDSGGQYLECTTDTTRTTHYGTPSSYMIESYTLVLMGTIDLAKVVWRKGEYGRTLELLARQPLWARGLDYNHGTGHGIGAYFSVHEGPGFIGSSRSPFYSQEELMPGMFFSDEPGFYEPGEFGIRLETVVMVENANTKYNFNGVQYLHFKPIALVPFEPKMINVSMLTNYQIDWLNAYHKMTEDQILPLLTTDLARNWLRERTKPVGTSTGPTRPDPCNPASTPLPIPTPLLLLLASTLLTLLF